MPFDSLPLDEAAAAFARFHDEPTLRGLSYALRHRETWPIGFAWQYEDCTSCAMGLAVDLIQPVPRPRYVYDHGMFVRAQFCLGWTAYEAIFESLNETHAIHRRQVTPEHVADAIDRYLATTA